MIPFVASLALAPKYTIIRDSFGVPTISAKTATAAYEGQGFAVAQDRLWQLEMSRRLSEGRLAEVFGPTSLASDKDVLTLGYAPSEIDAQLAALSKPARTALDAYAHGVNEWIEQATATGRLPAGYKRAGFKPRAWTPHDSAAIAIHLLREFGRGGAGEIRNLAILDYLRARPNIGDKAFNLVNDLAWLQDRKATPTVTPQDDPVRHQPTFCNPTLAGTKAQLAALPKANLFELLPGIQIAERKLSRQAAERLSVPFYTGSYCMVVSPKRSATREPLLLSGPQMGHTNPSIVHEVALVAPGLRVRGMDIPGAPGVVVGATPKFAWGLTSGIADVEDIYTFKTTKPDRYDFSGKQLPFKAVRIVVPVKGQTDVTITQQRTIYGPVVVRTPSGVFALRSAFRGHELSTIEAFFRLPSQTTAAGIDALVARTPMSFNFFYALGSGTIGYRYTGWVPVRRPGLDPRLPTPATPGNDWRGFIPPREMPHALNPKAGLFVNWNNKPVSWWPNGDTPAWGEIFRNTEILAALQHGDPRPGRANKLRATDLRDAVVAIAKHDETWRYFKPYLVASGAPWARGYDGSQIEGSIASTEYASFLHALRRELFLSTTGNFMSDTYFDLALQPTLMLHALRGQTAFDFLGGRKPADVVAAALKAMPPPSPYKAGSFAVPGHAPVLYSNRGTYIQLLEWLGHHWSMRTILPPGEAESGAHQLDQVPLARRFAFKPPVKP
ncbi:MAG: penicillin acylase family protein [Fimbriimonadaceae bacterium]